MQQSLQYQEQHIYFPLKKLQPIKKYIQESKILNQRLWQSDEHIEMITIRCPLNKNVPIFQVAHQFYGIIRYVNNSSQDFLRIISVNLQKQTLKNGKFFVQSIIREQGVISLQDIMFLIRSQRVYEYYYGLMQLAYMMLEKIEKLTQKHLNMLKKLDIHSLKFYSCKDSVQQGIFRVFIGLETIKFSIFDSTAQYKDYTNQIRMQLKQLNSFQMPSKRVALKFPLKAEQFLIQKNQLQDKNQKTKTSSQYSMLFLDHFFRYASDVFICCKNSFIGLVKVVKQKKLIQNPKSNLQTLCIKDPATEQITQGCMYQNLFCQHFVGFSKKVFQLQNCPICLAKIMINPSKADQVNINRLFMIIRDCFLSDNAAQFDYFIKQNVFKLRQNRVFSNMAHFAAYFKTKQNIRNRPQHNIFLKFQKICLLNKFWRKKNVFIEFEMIKYPVRGKYCKHIEFYDLTRVYEKYIQDPQKDNFQCFVCLQPILFEQILYLKQMELIINLAGQYFFNNQPSPQCVNLQIDHHMHSVFLTSQMEAGFNKKRTTLQIYKTIMDPMSKSQLIVQNWKEKRLNQTFSMFFFGQ